MPVFKELTAADIQTTKTSLSQLIDVVQNDISGSSTRRSYEMFVTSAADHTSQVYSVTSSLFQTVYDQDYTLQVANPIFDVTAGLYEDSPTVSGSFLGVDDSGKIMFSSESLMMREKIDIYRLHAAKLLGDNSQKFYSTLEQTDAGINEAIFIDFKRLFMRDKLKKQSFAMRFYTSATMDGSPNSSAYEKSIYNPFTGSNVGSTSAFGATLFTDANASSEIRIGIGGEYSEIVDSSNSNTKVGMIYYDAGVLVLDARKVMWYDQHISGTVSAVTASVHGANKSILGSSVMPGSNPNAKFIPDFFVSGSIDDIVDHITSCRFSSGSYTAITFQNQTTINSTLFFCRSTADEFNYSSNPTYVDDQQSIVVIENGQESNQTSFTYPTTIGLYDSSNNLLAVAKFSRPIEKNYEKDLTIRVRLDF